MFRIIRGFEICDMLLEEGLDSFHVPCCHNSPWYGPTLHLRTICRILELQPALCSISDPPSQRGIGYLCILGQSTSALPTKLPFFYMCTTSIQTPTYYRMMCTTCILSINYIQTTYHPPIGSSLQLTAYLRTTYKYFSI